MYISIGSDCAAKKRMEEFVFKDKPISHIFDWVLSDLNAVCYILEQSFEDDDFFNIEKLSILTKTIDNKYAIKHNDCYFISLHDASCDIPEKEAKKIVCEKYTRRLKRFIEHIKNPQNELTFIGLFDNHNPIQNGNMKIHDKDILRFFKVINRLSPLNTHKLVIITDNTTNLQGSEHYKNRISIINSKNYIIMKEYVADWYRFFLNWKQIFEDIPFKMLDNNNEA